jgi:hypothetical protein
MKNWNQQKVKILKVFLSMCRIELVYKTGVNCSEAITDSGESFAQNNRCALLMDSSFLSDNLPNRMSKAINKLIEFHGGHVVKEAY